MISWEDYKYQVVQIDLSKKKRESKWIAVCKSCQCERIISYTQAWNIIAKQFNNICIDCKDFPNNLNSLKGRIPWNKGVSYKLNRSYDKNKTRLEIVNTFGMLFTPEIKEKQRTAKLGKFGENANAWDGGKTSERILISSRDEYKQLRKDCFIRDNYCCQICNKRGGELEMDHIKEWCNYPELRFELSNLRTLCISCHKTTDNYGFKARKLVS